MIIRRTLPLLADKLAASANHWACWPTVVLEAHENRDGTPPKSWCKSTTDKTWVYAEWFTEHNALRQFVDAIELAADMQYYTWNPEDFRVLIAFDN